jgi:uncharacterized membrane protein YfcA
MLYVVYLVTGIVAGVIGGLLGSGGCALMMPVIRFGFHFDPAIAVGTMLTAVDFTAASGAIEHWKMKNVAIDSAWNAPVRSQSRTADEPRAIVYERRRQ